MKYLLLALVVACGPSASDIAKKRDPGATCVASDEYIAYCMIRGKPFICDRDTCLPAQFGALAPLLDGHRHRDSDDQTTSTMLMQ